MSWAVKISPGGVVWMEVTHPLIHSFFIHVFICSFTHFLGAFGGQLEMWKLE